MSEAEPDDLGSKLHDIIHRLCREGGCALGISMLGKAVALLHVLEEGMRSLLELMDDTPYPKCILLFGALARS